MSRRSSPWRPPPPTEAHERYRRACLRPLPGTEAWGWCSPVGRQPRTLGERLWPKVWGPWYDDSIGHDDCWLWCGHAVDGWNYGRIHAPTAEDPKRLIGAHVAAYLLVVGPLPPGQLVRHCCGRHLCATAATWRRGPLSRMRPTSGRPDTRPAAGAHRRQRQEGRAA